MTRSRSEPEGGGEAALPAADDRRRRRSARRRASRRGRGIQGAARVVEQLEIPLDAAACWAACASPSLTSFARRQLTLHALHVEVDAVQELVVGDLPGLRALLAAWSTIGPFQIANVPSPSPFFTVVELLS